MSKHKIFSVRQSSTLPLPLHSVVYIILTNHPKSVTKFLTTSIPLTPLSLEKPSTNITTLYTYTDTSLP